MCTAFVLGLERERCGIPLVEWGLLEWMFWRGSEGRMAIGSFVLIEILIEVFVVLYYHRGLVCVPANTLQMLAGMTKTSDFLENLMLQAEKKYPLDY